MIYAVIGSNYGDEGKGLVTDFLANQAMKPLVIRHNGGSQAGHTVVDPKGLRHVFHSLGAGTFVGAPTFLSHFFVLNPFLFVKEYAELKVLGVIIPKIYLDPRLLITTPFDVMLNQAAERKRNKDRHGSVGAGVGETIARAEAGFKLSCLDVKNGDLDSILEKIRQEYVPARKKVLKIEKLEIEDKAETENLLKNFSEECRAMMSVCEIVKWEDLNWKGDLIFEGAQGLLLDSEDKQRFPHVSRSKTGLENIIQMTSVLEPQAIHAYYVTRPYLTKHGAGPLENETENPYNIVDQTNSENEFQGKLRFGLFDPKFVAINIQKDLMASRCPIEVVPTIAMTCVDQLLGGKIKTSSGEFDPKDACNFMAGYMGTTSCLMSYGPTRTTIKEHWAL